MKIILNGERRNILDNISLKNFIADLSLKENLDLSGAVVLVNDSLEKKETWENLILKENDTLEVLCFVSGG